MCLRKLPAGEDRVFFDLAVWDGKRHNTVKLWCQCGPDDDGEAAMISMLGGED